VSYHINQFNRENEIIVAKDGVSAECVRYETGKFFLNHHGWTITCTDVITKKYMFYALQSIQQELLNIAQGTAQLGINQQNFYKLKIPIPSIERQQQIVEYCEFNDELIQQLKKEIEQNKKQAKLFLAGAVSLSGNSVVEEIVGSVFTDDSRMKEPDEEDPNVVETSTNCAEVLDTDEFFEDDLAGEEFVFGSVDFGEKAIDFQEEKHSLVIEDSDSSQVVNCNQKKRENAEEPSCCPESNKKTKLYPMFLRGGKK
jgi:hypothetical protein